DEAVIAARGELDPARGLLRLAAVTTVGDRLVPELLRRFRQRHPEVEMRLEVGPSARVWQLFADRLGDVVVARRPPHRARRTGPAGGGGPAGSTHSWWSARRRWWTAGTPRPPPGCCGSPDRALGPPARR